MYRALPDRPNLEHLKKQAKTLLPQLQAENPSAQLADAQHRLAREYGFASWPKLKAHVDAREGRPAPAAHPFDGRWVADVERSRRQIQRDDAKMNRALAFCVRPVSCRLASPRCCR